VWRCALPGHGHRTTHAFLALFSAPGAVDLLLHLLLGEPLGRASIARLAAGGLVAWLPAHRSLR
jgi:hypothetical protein